jgi:hypothetical protein
MEATQEQHITRILTREQAQDWALAHDAPGELHRETVDTRRWYSVELVVFTAPDDGQVYGVQCRRPLTEIQEGLDPWDDSEQVTLTHYEAYEKTVTAWRPAKATASASGMNKSGMNKVERLARDLIGIPDGI